MKRATPPVSFTNRSTALGNFARLYQEGTKLSGSNVIIGYPQDEGVRKNQGHVGQNLGPRHFRQSFYKLQSSFEQIESIGGIIDFGDICSEEEKLSVEEAQERLHQAVFFCLSSGAKKVIIVGGGHDLSYGSYKAHARFATNQLPLLNLDAHYDLRSSLEGGANSGTPFFQAIQDPLCKNALDEGRLLFELGIQDDYNPPELRIFAEKLGVKILSYEVDNRSYRSSDSKTYTNISHFIDSHLDPTSPIHLSLDLDVFDSNIACATSAATPFAPAADELIPLIILLSKRARVIDVAELCPCRDTNEKTARLAAGLVWRCLKKLP